MVGELTLRGARRRAAKPLAASSPPSPRARGAKPRSLWGEDRSRTGEYGGTVRTPSTSARAARSALAVGTFVNGPGYGATGVRLHTSRAYSRIARSEEKYPMQATLRIAFAAHARGSAKRAAARAWASA
jgi:hypothetical protein